MGLIQQIYKTGEKRSTACARLTANTPWVKIKNFPVNF